MAQTYTFDSAGNRWTFEKVSRKRDATCGYCTGCQEIVEGTAFWDWTRSAYMHSKRGPEHKVVPVKLTTVLRIKE